MTPPMSTPQEQREYQRQWMASRRAEWLAGKSCAECGSMTLLEIDHIDPKEKAIPISRLWSFTEDKRNAELAKCQVLCKNHHQMKTYGWATPELPHGTKTMYEIRRCRCDECRAWSAAKQRRKVANRKARDALTVRQGVPMP